MVELEDPIDGIDEVPGPPHAEIVDPAASLLDADASAGLAPEAPPPVPSAV